MFLYLNSKFILEYCALSTLIREVIKYCFGFATVIGMNINQWNLICGKYHENGQGYYAETPEN